MLLKIKIIYQYILITCIKNARILQGDIIHKLQKNKTTSDVNPDTKTLEIFELRAINNNYCKKYYNINVQQGNFTNCQKCTSMYKLMQYQYVTV